MNFYTEWLPQPKGRLFKFLLIMKLTFVVLITSFLQLSYGAANAQNVTLSEKNTSLLNVFRKLNKSVGYNFLYDLDVLKEAKPVTIEIRNTDIKEALRRIFSEQPLGYTIKNNTIIIHRKPVEGMPLIIRSFVDIRGKVVDENGQPMAGASVKVKGSNLGAVTDVTGAFSLKDVTEGATLVVSYIGYENKEVTASNGLTITLTPQAGLLADAVVIGYGTQKKSVVTGAIASVKATDLKDMPVVRIEQSLQGRASGVTVTTSSGQPGDGGVVRIRGIANINNANPLYVVDGVVINGGIEFLNQSDIESIEVLKDAASAAIYGTRAANGVIIVSTKKGSNTGRIRVEYNNYIGTQAPSTKLNLLNATQYATIYNESQLADGVTGVRFPNPAQYGEGTNWQEAVFNNKAMIQNHDLNMSGGNDKSVYYGSFSYFDQDGIVATQNSKFKRFTARFNFEHKITKNIKFGNSIGYTRINSIGVSTNTEYGSPLSRAINMDPITPIVETDPAKYGLPKYLNNPVVRNDAGFPYGISDYAQSEILNPVAALQVAQGNSWSDKVVGNAFVEVEFLKGLKLRSTGGVDLAFWGGQSFRPIYYLNSINQSTLTAYTRDSNRGLFWSLENTLSYDKTIGKHVITALVGYSAQKNKGETNGGIKEGIPVDNIRDASLQFPVARTNSDFYGGEYQNTLNSIFGRLIYNYDEKYLFTGIIRRDGSSRFGPNNKYGYFPSGSAGWVASREDFWPKNNIVTFLKFRGSYGVNGNDNIPDFSYLATVSGGRNYSLGTASGQTLTNGVSPNALSNPDLKWEETSSFDLGFDATLFEGITLSTSYFNKKTYGMLLQQVVPSYVGNSGPYANTADLYNRGFEIELGWNKRVGEVSFRIAGNAAFIKNEVTLLGADKDYIPSRQTITPQSLEVTRVAVGQSVDSFFGYQTAGLFQNQAEINNYKNGAGALIQPNAKPGDIKFLDLNGDGVISDADRTFLGRSNPNFTYGLTFSAKYKGFDVSIFGQGVSGNMIFNGLRRFDLSPSNYTTNILNRWTGEGTSNTVPRATLADDNKNYSRVSNLFLESGAYFRLKNVQLGYTLPKTLVNKVGLDNLKFYVMANNLFTLTKYNGYDPEIGGGSLGVDRGFYPQARSFFVGVNVGF